MSSLTREFVGGWADHSAELAEIDRVLAAVKAARERAIAAHIARHRTGDEPRLASENLIRPRGSGEDGCQAVRADGAYVQVEVARSSVGLTMKRTWITRRIEDADDRDAVVRELVGLVDNEAEASARRRRAELMGVR